MSKFTDLEHSTAVKNTLYWRSTTPDTLEKEYEYGRYHERLKDYAEAVRWYTSASDKGHIPARYAYSICARNQLGIRENYQQEENMLPEVFAYYRDLKMTPEDYYRLGILYKYGLGTEKSESMAFRNFSIAAEQNFGDALHEIALFYKEGTGSCKKNDNLARKYLREAYDEHCEEAIFTDFELFHGEFAQYEYQREITEAYSFRLGQYIRVAELRRTKESYMHVIEMYKNGFPGDTGEKREAFIRKGDKYMKLMAELS